MTPSVSRSTTFAALSRSGIRVSSGPIRLTYLDGAIVDIAETGPHGKARAFALGRRFGNAVERNRARRRLRAAFEQSAPRAPEGAYLIGAQRGVLTAPFAELVEAFDRCFDRLVSQRTVRSS